VINHLNVVHSHETALKVIFYSYNCFDYEWCGSPPRCFFFFFFGVLKLQRILMFIGWRLCRYATECSRFLAMQRVKWHNGTHLLLCFTSRDNGRITIYGWRSRTYLKPKDWQRQKNKCKHWCDKHKVKRFDGEESPKCIYIY